MHVLSAWGTAQPLLQGLLMEARERNAHIHLLDRLFRRRRVRLVRRVEMIQFPIFAPRQGCALVADSISRTIFSGWAQAPA